MLMSMNVFHQTTTPKLLNFPSVSCIGRRRRSSSSHFLVSYPATTIIFFISCYSEFILKFCPVLFALPKEIEEYPSGDEEIQEHKEHSISILSDDVKEEQSKKLSSGEVKKLEFEVREATPDVERAAAACLKAEEFYEQANEYKEMCDGYESTSEPYMCVVAVQKEGENVIAVLGTLDLIFLMPDKGDSKEVWMAGKKARIGNVVVVELARRQGVASRMVKFAIECAKKEGAPQMFVKPDLDDESAQALYKKMGFTENGIDEIENQYVYCLNINSIR
ncbi:hypothetical protein MKW94_009508 [Papaver nudicaule]|uniref:N-acetyltransferase domain-containing protein n=1 Tax=Papaver nudicaule TaxID=74823 RepID=A0AA41S3E0_PAPNU|nr:hypothetical protein [Papaver nudicaule]